MDHFRGQFLGAGQCGDRFADVLPLCVRSSDVEEKTGLSFRGETGWIYLLCQFKGFTGVPKVDSDRDGVNPHVRRPELGVEVVAVLPEAVGDLPGFVDARPCGGSCSFPGRDDGKDQVHGAEQRQFLRPAVFTYDAWAQCGDGGLGDAFGLLVAPQSHEGVCHAEVPGDHLKGVAGLLRGGERPVGGDPCGSASPCWANAAAMA